MCFSIKLSRCEPSAFMRQILPSRLSQNTLPPALSTTLHSGFRRE